MLQKYSIKLRKLDEKNIWERQYEWLRIIKHYSSVNGKFKSGSNQVERKKNIIISLKGLWQWSWFWMLNNFQ